MSSLVGGKLDSKPEEMDVVGHQDVGGTEELLSRSGVQEQFTEESVEGGIEPVGGAALEGNRPEHGGEAAVMFSSQPWQMVHLGLGSRGRRGHTEKCGALPSAATSWSLRRRRSVATPGINAPVGRGGKHFLEA